MTSLTLDGRHREMLKSFDKLGNNLQKYENKLDKLKKKYEKLNKKGKRQCTDEEIDEMFKLQDEIEEIENKIKTVQSTDQTSEYYLNTSDLLHKYYSNKYSCEDCVHDDNGGDVTEQKQGSNLLNFFNSNNNIGDMNKFVKKKNKFKNTDIFDEYLRKTDEKYSGKIEYNNDTYYCNKCNSEKTLISCEAISTCTSCGSSERVVIDSDKPSYKEPPTDINYFAFLIVCIDYFYDLWAKIVKNPKFWLVV